MFKLIALIMAAAMLASCEFVSIDKSKVAATWNKDTAVCDGEVETRSFDLSGFQSIVLNGHADVDVFQGDVFEVTVTANTELFQHLDYYVEDGVLILQTKDRKSVKAKKYDVKITAPVLNKITVNGASDMNLHRYAAEEGLELEVNGAGDLAFEGGFTAPSLKVVVNGAGDIDAEGLDLQDLVVEVNGAGDAEVSGRTVNATFRIAGAGDIDARHLAKEHVESSKSGVGSIKL